MLQRDPGYLQLDLVLTQHREGKKPKPQLPEVPEQQQEGTLEQVLNTRRELEEQRQRHYQEAMGEIHQQQREALGVIDGVVFQLIQERENMERYLRMITTNLSQITKAKTEDTSLRDEIKV